MNLNTAIQLYQGKKDNIGSKTNLHEVIDLIQGPTFKTHIEKLHSFNDELKHLKNKLATEPEETKDEWKRLVVRQQELCDKQKGALLAVTWSGTFTTRKATALEQYSRLHCLDIDKVANVQELFEKLSMWQYTFLCFISPSGEGIKVIVKTDATPEQHKEYFIALQASLLKEFQLEIDPSGKDINRLCFLTYFPRLVHNAKAATFTVWVKTEPEEIQAEVVQEKKLSKKQQSDLQSTGEDLYSVIHFTDKLITYAEGSRNNYIHQFACNANRKGFSISETLGFSTGYFTDVQQSEIEATVKSAFTHNTHEHGKFKKQVKDPGAANVSDISGDRNRPADQKNNSKSNGKNDVDGKPGFKKGMGSGDKPAERYTQFWKERKIKKGKGDNQYDVTVYDLKRVEFTDFLLELGFHLIDTDGLGYQICYSKDGIIEPIDPRVIKKHVFAWCKKNVDREIEEMLRKGQKQFFASNEMDALYTKNVEMKTDTEKESFFYFNNAWVTVTDKDILCRPYSELDKFIWAGTKKKA